MSFKLSWCLPRRHRLMVLLLICLLLLAAWAIWIIKPYSEQQVKKSILQLERRSYFVLRSEEHTSELQSRQYLVCRLLLEKKKKIVPLISTYLLSTYHFKIS